MKKAISLLFFLGIMALSELFAQTPGAFQYQALIQNAQAGQSINVRFTIRKATVMGTAVFTETHATNVAANGTVNLQIGTGTPGIGSYGLNEIDWTTGIYFMQVEVDTNGAYTTLSTQQLLSVPYAKYAQAANSLRIKSPDGSTWDITIDNNGSVSSTKVQ
jgi:hypothetical protein